MEEIPLYPEAPRLAVEAVQPLSFDSHCSRCSLSQRARTICMSPVRAGARDQQPPGGLLVVGDCPGQTEDATGVPFTGESGKLLRALVGKVWRSPVVFDNAVKCSPGGSGPPSDKAVVACRRYLAAVLRDCLPSRVLAFGERAIFGLTGRSLNPMSVRHGYGWASTVGDAPVPVFFLPNATIGVRNRFVREWLAADIAWAVAHKPEPPPWKGRALVVQTLEDALECERQLLAAPWFSYDVESSGLMFAAFVVLCGSMAVPGSDDVWTWDRPAYVDPAIRQVLCRLMANPKARKVGASFKFDQNATTQELGVPVRGLVGDVRLMRKLMESDSEGKLEVMAELVGMGGHKREAQVALVKAGRQVVSIAKRNANTRQGNLFAEAFFHRGEGDTLPLPEAVVQSIKSGVRIKVFAYGLVPRVTRLRYNALDALSTAKLHVELTRRLSQEAPQLGAIWRKVVLPATEAIQHVERWGVATDRAAMEAFEAYLDVKLRDIKARLQTYAPDLNPDATGEVEELLFKKLGLPPQRETKLGYSTDADTLEALEGKHPVVADILEWRKVSKLKGTYGTGLLRHIRGDGRIHPSILLDGASTGRTSCQEPNLQNIPRDADSVEGRMARDCFIAPPGMVLLSADYSQLELRLAAMLSGDPVMLQMFREGGDFHMATARFIAPVVWGIKPEEVQKSHRSAAKSFNFGILYGMGDEAVAAKAGCTVAVASQIREAVLGRFKVLASWIRERLNYSRRSGICWTWWEGDRARRRSLWRIGDQDDAARANAERCSWNTPIQGTGSDYCIASLAAVVQWLLEDAVPAKLVLPVHDSLLLEVREDCVDEVAWQVHRIMTSWPSGNVSLDVDIETGPAWGSLEKYDKRKLA